MRVLPVVGTLHEVMVIRDLTYLDVRRPAIIVESRSRRMGGHQQEGQWASGNRDCMALFASLLLLADLRALAAHQFEEVHWRRWAEDLINLIVDTGHAMDTTSSKNKCLVVRDLVHNIEPSKLDPPPDGGAMIDCGDVGPEAMDELFRLHPGEIWHVFAALKSQLSARLVVLQQECKRVIKTGRMDQHHLVEEQYIQILLQCLLELCLPLHPLLPLYCSLGRRMEFFLPRGTHLRRDTRFGGRFSWQRLGRRRCR